MKRNTLIIIIVAVVIVAVAGVAVLLMGSPGKGTTQYATFQLDWVPGGAHLPYFVAAKMFWPQMGLDINIIRGTGSADTMAKVGTGAVEFGAATMDAIISGRSASVLPVKAIGSAILKCDTGYLWVKGRDAGRGIVNKDSLSTFSGKVLLQPVYGTSVKLLPVFEKAIGIPDGSIIVQNTDPGAVIPGLIKGDGDLGAPSIGQQAVYQAAFSKESLEADWLWVKDYGIDLMGDSLLTSDRIIHDNPDMVRKFVEGIQQGFVWALSHEAEAAQIIDEYIPGLAGQDASTIANFDERYKETIDKTVMSQHGAYYMPDSLVQSTVTNVYTMYNIGTDFQMINWADVFTNQFINPSYYPATYPW